MRHCKLCGKPEGAFNLSSYGGYSLCDEHKEKCERASEKLGHTPQQTVERLFVYVQRGEKV